MNKVDILLELIPGYPVLWQTAKTDISHLNSIEKYI